MTNDVYTLYRNLANADAKLVRQLQGEFEHILGIKIDDKIFNAMYIQARYLPEFSILPRITFKGIHLKSKGRLPLAANFLYKQFSRNKIDNSVIPKDCLNIANKISEQGYCVIENFLDTNAVEQIKEELNRYTYYAPMGKRKVTYTLEQLRSPASAVDASLNSMNSTQCIGNDVPGDSQIGRLMINPFMANISSAYFQTQSYLTLAVGFHTRAKDPKYFSAADIHGNAQQWHFDYSDLRFLKFFIYLTDVEPENGPHTLVANTHEERLVYPKRAEDFYEAGFRIHDNGEMEGVIKDEWVNKTFDSKRIVAIAGRKGTLIVENTSGLHKGGYCTSGTREMLSFSYAISNVGDANAQPTLDYNMPDFGRNSHLATVLKSLKQEQFDKENAFKAQPTMMKKIKGKIKSLVRR